jgi:hypothetical protein
LAATELKIIDIWLDEITGKRVNPDGATTSLLKIPTIYVGDKMRLNFRIYEGGILEYPVNAGSEINLSVKNLKSDDTILANALDTDFIAAAWDAADAYVKIPLSSIVVTNGSFAVNNLVTESTSGATGRVFFFDNTNKQIWIKAVSGTFTGAETLTETLPDSTAGATATTGTPLIENFAKANGRVACDLTLNTINLVDFMGGRDDAKVNFEITEKFADGTHRTLGQFEVTVTQDLFNTGDDQTKLKTVLPNDYLTEIREDLTPVLGADLEGNNKQLLDLLKILVKQIKVGEAGGVSTGLVVIEREAGDPSALVLNGVGDTVGMAFKLSDILKWNFSQQNTGQLQVQDSANQNFMQFAGTVAAGGTLDLHAVYSNDKQPSFLATHSSGDQIDVTGGGQIYTPIFETEVFDTASNYDHTTGIFTAPSTGKYCFSVHLRMDDLNNATTHNILSINLNTSNREHKGCRIDPTNLQTSDNELRIRESFLNVDMDAGDTAKVFLTVSGGTKIVDLRAGTGFFSGRKVL